MRKGLEVRHLVARMRRLLLACVPCLLTAALLPSPALAQGEGMINGPFLDKGLSDEAEVESADAENEQEELEEHQKRRILPFLADAARKRGVVLPRTFGIGAVYVTNDSVAVGDQLAISVATGNNEPSENLIELPQVRAESLETRVNSVQAKFDLFLLPFYNVFVSLGRVTGDVDVGLLIDLDELLPPIFCRFNECGVRPLNFTLPVDNTTMTLGNTLAYGGTFGGSGNGWFVTATGTRTLSVSSKERSDIETTSASARLGLRLKAGEQFYVSPYAGYAYFDQEAVVTGVARLQDFFESGEQISIRYRFRVDNEHKSKGVIGVNVETSPGLYLQSEYNFGRGGDSLIFSSTVRF